jgi:D-alanyl-D-alanine carboxypeptidase
MNRVAKALGLSQCNFKNPHGLAEEGSNSCALDAARLSAAAMSDPRFASIVACKEYEIKLGGRRIIWENTNTYLGDTRLAPGTVVDGVKTGITPGAQACLVLHAQTDKAAALASLNAPKWKLDAAAAAASELSKSKGGTMGAQLVVAGYAAASKSANASSGPPGSIRIDEFFSVTLGSKNKAMRYLDNAKLLSYAALSVLKLRDPTSAKSVAEAGAPSSLLMIKKSIASPSITSSSPKSSSAVSEVLKLASVAAKVK